MTDKLLSNQSLARGGSITSQDGRFELTLQESDGNLVLKWTDGGVFWASNTAGSTAAEAIMQASDGDFVLYGPNREVLWRSNSTGHPDAILTVQNDGNVVLSDESGPYWATAAPGILLGDELFQVKVTGSLFSPSGEVAIIYSYDVPVVDGDGEMSHHSRSIDDPILTQADSVGGFQNVIIPVSEEAITVQVGAKDITSAKKVCAQIRPFDPGCQCDPAAF